MKTFTRASIRTHCVGAEWPDFLGSVDIGESFVIETERLNLANGPIAVNGVEAGDPIAVTVERVEILPPFIAPNGGPFFEGLGDSPSLEYAEGYLLFPKHFRLKARPSVGNIAVLPAPTQRIRELARTDPAGRGWRRVVNDPRAKHCHQDCRHLGAGSKIHLRAQVRGAGICAADVHAYIAQGEVAFAGIEVNANIGLRVERSVGWLVDWPLIETDDEIMLFCSDTNILDGTSDQQYVDVVREAYRAMREVVAARINGTIADANPIVATALDIRNCAIYGLGNYVRKDGKTEAPDRDIAVVACLPKDVFVGFPSVRLRRREQ
jgi:acetamidase/formamidase